MPLWAQKIISTGGWIASAVSITISVWWWTGHQVAMWLLDARWLMLIAGVAALIYIKCEHILQALGETFDIGKLYGLSLVKPEERESQ